MSRHPPMPWDHCAVQEDSPCITILHVDIGVICRFMSHMTHKQAKTEQSPVSGSNWTMSRCPPPNMWLNAWCMCPKATKGMSAPSERPASNAARRSLSPKSPALQEAHSNDCLALECTGLACQIGSNAAPALGLKSLPQGSNRLAPKPDGPLWPTSTTGSPLGWFRSTPAIRSPDSVMLLSECSCLTSLGIVLLPCSVDERTDFKLDLNLWSEAVIGKHIRL